MSRKGTNHLPETMMDKNGGESEYGFFQARVVQ